MIQDLPMPQSGEGVCTERTVMGPLECAADTGTTVCLTANVFQLAHQVIRDTIPDSMNIVLQQIWQELKSREEDHKLLSLETDITIKEKPIDFEDAKLPVGNFLMKAPIEDVHKGGSTSPHVQSESDKRSRKRSRHSRKRLRCPQCSSSFMHGPYGAGLEVLVGHIYMKHKRLQVSSLSATRGRYSAIIKDAVAQGYLPTCSGLVLPSY